MAFKFNWTTFDKSFIDEAQDKLAEALNKGITNQMIGSIKVEELNMGTKAPDLEVMEIGDLSEEKFKGIFKIIYQGDAYIVIRTTVQINPLVVSETPITLSLGSGIIAADHPLPIPVRLRISNLKLSGIAALGFSNKGITFCFKNDPLENINVSSTFDSMPAIKKLIERIIKSQISAFLMEDVPGLIHNFSKSSNNSSDQNSHNRSYSGDTYVPYSPSTYDSDSIYGDESDNIYSSNQTLIGEENEMMEWKRKWKGNDLNLPDSSISFENRIILYRGLKCLKTVNANRGILRLLNPSLNDYLCQSIHIDSWLITPPFSPIPLYIPKASYPSYTKDKHFSIVDYLRRTAITRTSYNQQHQRLISEGFDINNVSDDNPFKRLQQPTETIIYNIPSPITSPRLKSSMTNSSSNPNRSILFNSNKTLVSDGDISICSHHGYNYTHTYHRGQRKAKSSNKSNNLNNRKSTLSSKRSSQISSATTLFSDQENETLLNSSNSSSSVINNNNNKELENVVINKNNMDNNNNDKINLVQKKAEFDRIIPRLSSPRLSLYVTGNKGHIRGYSSQSNISDISNTPSTSSNVATSSNMNSQNNNGTISNDNVFLSLLNNNNNNGINGTSVNIYSRNNSIVSNTNTNNNNVNGKIVNTNSNIPNNLTGYNSDGESTVCEEFPAEIVIEPSNNSMAAQLNNLMNSNQTISPYTRTLEHFAYRSFPHSKSNYKRRYHRQRHNHRLKIHVDGLMGSSSSTSTVGSSIGNKTQTSTPTTNVSSPSPVLNN